MADTEQIAMANASRRTVKIRLSTLPHPSHAADGSTCADPTAFLAFSVSFGYTIP